MNALIVTGLKKTQQSISDVINYAGGYDITTALSGADARKLALESIYDLIIINGELTDERGYDLALKIASKKEGGVILIENAANFQESSAALSAYGIIVIAKPISKNTLYAAVQMVKATNMRLKLLKDENKDLVVKMEELKLVNRAKIIIMQNFGYSEDQAHKYIEKQSMNMRVSKNAIAMDILKTYEK